ncbi:MAG: hypothetical protein EON90_13260 [Brevundimonas sp.]|nr:MAG: hypothetical protein EON90_13260 [Brevundimonas sp.]
MTDDDDAPVYPLISFTTGIIDGQIGLELEFATDREDYENRSGSLIATVMTPENAIEIGKALIERGQLARRDAGQSN